MVQDRIALIENPVEGDEKIPEGGPEEMLLKQIQAVLYSTEDGFEVPEGQEVSCNILSDQYKKDSSTFTSLQPALDEEEVF